MTLRFAWIFVLLSFVHLAWADVPGTMTFQGTLTNDAGQPLNETISVTLTLYDATNDGNNLWTETQSVTVNHGFLKVTVGETNPIDANLIDGQTPLYLGVAIGEDEEMTPRQVVSSVPYATRASTVEQVTGDITPNTVSVNGNLVIDETGAWVGSPAGLEGPQGPEGPQGESVAMWSADLGDCPTGGLGFQVGEGDIQYICNGADGAQGPQGEQGPAGPAGADGAQGETGLQGPAGPAGPAGADGAQGPQGEQGPRGYSAVPTTTVPQGNLDTLVSERNVGEVAMTIGSDSLPVIAYVDSEKNLYLIHCNDIACTTHSETTLDDRGVTGTTDVDIAIGINGNPVVSAHMEDYGNLVVKICDNPSCTTFSHHGLNSGSDVVGKYHSLAIGADGYPVLSYYDETNTRLSLVHCEDVNCESWNRIYNMDQDETYYGTSNSIAISPSLGVPKVAFSSSNGLKVCTCTTASCNERSCELVIGSRLYQPGEIAMNTGWAPAFPVMNGQSLYHRSCTTSTCSESSSSTISSTPMPLTPGTEARLRYDSSGLPAYLYVRFSSFYFRIVRCANLSCSEKTYAGYIQSNLGTYPTANGTFTYSFGVDGTPIIAYKDRSSGQLKVLKCSNGYCAANYTRR